MKMCRKTSFRILFSLAILFFFGYHGYSNSNMQRCFVEFSAGMDNAENSLNSDNDSFNDDQITQTDKFSSKVTLKNQIPIPQNCFLIFSFCFSIWQPPKNS